MTGYVELQVTSNFSFLRGASHPEELVLAAAALGHAAAAIADRNTLAGIVRAHVAAKQAGLRLVVGARLVLAADEGPAPPDLLCFPTDRAAYGRLSRLITLGRRRAPKGECRIGLADVFAHDAGQQFVVLPPAAPDAGFADGLRALAGRWPGRCHLGAALPYRGDDRRRLADLAALARMAGVPLVAGNDVHYHVAARRPLQDVLTCIREHCTLAEAGYRLAGNAERHLKPADEMARLFRDVPEAVLATLALADRCRFSLDELRYEYPVEAAADGRTPQQELERLVAAGAAERYGGAPDPKVRGMLDHELELIGRLGYAPYFLTVHDMVRFARSQGILCQGRGSAANSAVCYCLGITAVDPSRLDLLFERFISAARGEPPDIDVDFEHERREEVIQYVYRKYGRDRAGLAATVIRYRARSAVREVGKAVGLSADVVAALAGNLWGWGEEDVQAERVRELGLDPAEPAIARTLHLARELIGFPRHLSQHVGGFVITAGPLDEVVPIGNAAMAERTFVEWDKDDLDALGILKIDVLALGMLTCIARAFGLMERHSGERLSLATVPAEDPAVYEMLSLGDSVGVFQVESRAQMAMLPRLRPRNFYDLVIEVAIVRPGPIQGDMVHPYLRRRAGREPVSFPSKELEGVLGKTLGVPLFQEQAMRIAIVAAGFTPDEADRLRRAMATFRRTGTIHSFGEKLVEGMVANGYERDFAERCFRQIEGFGEYGFPESHAASFALLVYVSAWLKRHRPAAFAAGLLNAQPMGFYAPAQIVRDARDHGVEVRGLDVNRSDWDCTLEPGEGPDGAALRLGLRLVKGLKEADVRALVAGRQGGYADVADLWRRAGLAPDALARLADADAFRSAGLDRRRALWAVKGLGPPPLPLFRAADAAAAGRPLAAAPATGPVALPEMPLGEHVVQDYTWTGLSLKEHPVRLLRGALAPWRPLPNARLAEVPAGRLVRVAGIVLVRQRPGTARGVIFVTLEDETGVANVVVRPPVFERFRRTVLAARLMLAEGRVEREGIVVHLLADRLVDLSGELRRLAEADAMPAPLARADEVRRPQRDPREAVPKGRSFR